MKRQWEWDHEQQILRSGDWMLIEEDEGMFSLYYTARLVVRNTLGICFDSAERAIGKLENNK